MALLDVCEISDWLKEDNFNAQTASIDRVNHFSFAAQTPEFAVPVGLDVSDLWFRCAHARYHSLGFGSMCFGFSFNGLDPSEAKRAHNVWQYIFLKKPPPLFYAA